MTTFDRALKRAFDIAFSAALLTLTSWLILIGWVVATIDTRRNGFFTQVRVGKGGALFKVIKLRTMRDMAGHTSTVTHNRDPRITPLGRLLRKAKLDELPQFINVLMGDMSVVGPRPDVPGYADNLTGNDRVILTVRPGITGPATLKYRHEETILAQQADPERYNREVIYPDKVRINRQYIERYSFLSDIGYIIQTVTGR